MKNIKISIMVIVICFAVIVLIFTLKNTEEQNYQEIVPEEQNYQEIVPEEQNSKTDIDNHEDPVFVKNKQAAQKNLSETIVRKNMVKTEIRSTNREALGTAPSEGAVPQEEIEEIKKSIIYTEWLVTIERTLGDTIDDKMKKSIKEQQVELLYKKQVLQSEYLSDNVDWNTYIQSLQELAAWNQKFYQDALTDEEYEKLYNCKKGRETQEVIKYTMTPPEDSEVFVLFSQIKGSHPDIKTEQDLYQKIDSYKINQLIKIEKERLREEQALSVKFDSGKIDDAQLNEYIELNNNFYYENAHSILNQEEFKFIYGE